jgi:hypothetical protein
MQEYKIEAENVYDMNEKNFLMSITRRSKRVFFQAVLGTKV